MLWTIFVILLIMWALGLVTSYTLGGFVHILLVIALVALFRGVESCSCFGFKKRGGLVCASIR
jgi:Family of unknown function (DUF5670)